MKTAEEKAGFAEESRQLQDALIKLGIAYKSVAEERDSERRGTLQESEREQLLLNQIQTQKQMYDELLEQKNNAIAALENQVNEQQHRALQAQKEWVQQLQQFNEEQLQVQRDEELERQTYQLQFQQLLEEKEREVQTLKSQIHNRGSTVMQT